MSHLSIGIFRVNKFCAHYEKRSHAGIVLHVEQHAYYDKLQHDRIDCVVKTSGIAYLSQCPPLKGCRLLLNE